MTTRREFLKKSALAGGALSSGILGGGAVGLGEGILALSPQPTGPSRSNPPGSPLRILILGGTGFIGPHLVRRCLERGHDVTLFNRGRTEPRLFPELFTDLEVRIGDRNDDISSLEDGRWDAVIDNSGYTADQVRATAQLLRDSADQYLFTSTRAVYSDYTHPTMDEDAPIGVPGVPEEEWSGYGPLKALAEGVVEEAFPDGTTIVRPPIITGPGDRTDRFTYWYVRIDRGGEVIAPGDPSDPVQYTDVRDLAEFYVHLLEEGTTGIFNPEAPAAPLSSAEFLYGVRAVTSSPVQFTWVDWSFLEEHGLRGGSEIPGWRPPEGDWLNYGRIDNRRALEAGITFRPLAVTARDTLEWWKEARGAAGEELGAGISAEEEAQVLEAWRRSG